jgi:hypothetical protein
MSHDEQLRLEHGAEPLKKAPPPHGIVASRFRPISWMPVHQLGLAISFRSVGASAKILESLAIAISNDEDDRQRRMCGVDHLHELDSVISGLAIREHDIDSIPPAINRSVS